MDEKNQKTDSSRKTNTSQETKNPKRSSEALDSNKPLNRNKRNDMGPCPWDDLEIRTVSNVQQCRDVVRELRLHCKEYNVLGSSCTKPEFNSQKPSLLSLSSPLGLCALFHLSVLRNIPKELKELLEDKNILKVGFDAFYMASKLTLYNVYASRIFDVRYLVPACSRSIALSDLSAKHLNIQLRASFWFKDALWRHSKPNIDAINYAARVVRIVIELFKKFEQKERDASSTSSEQQQQQQQQQQIVHKFIKNKCQSYINKVYYEWENEIKYPDPQRVLHSPEVHVINNVAKCRDIAKKIRKHCHKNKVLGLSCQYSNSIVTLLQLITYDGLCALIQLNRIQTIPAELQDILNDENILKIGVHVFKAAERLEADYDVHALSTLDLRYLAIECQISEHNDFHRLSAVHLNVNTRPDDWRLLFTDWKSESVSKAAIKYAVNYVHVTIELFKVFEKKLMEERFSGDRTKFIDELCVPNLDQEYPKPKTSVVKHQAWLTLPEQEIFVASTAEECKAVLKRLQEHCKEYSVIGFDAEWVPKGRRKVALCQLSTHRGLCALIRLCKLETIPDELKQLLDDPNILKVGILALKDAKKLFHDYRLDVSSTLDLKIFAKQLKYRETGLGGLAEKVLHVKLDYKKRGRIVNRLHNAWEKSTLDEVNIKYAANDAHVGIELFKKFHEKLMPRNSTGDLTVDLQQFLGIYCEKHKQSTKKVKKRNKENVGPAESMEGKEIE